VLKRIIIILTFLLLSSLIFAATLDQTELYVSTSVPQTFSVKIVGGNVTVPTTKSVFDGLDAVGTSSSPITFSTEDVNTSVRKQLKVLAYCNLGPTQIIKVTANPMTASGVNTKIGYEVRLIESPTTTETVSKSVTSKTFNLTTFSVNGFTIASKTFDIQLSKTDWEAAAAGAYSTTWTIDLTTP